jgi:stage III sporulation protein AG
VNGKTVVVKEMYPKIIGVLIVAEGAGNIGVMTRIQKATTSLLDIEINQIEILTMK